MKKYEDLVKLLKEVQRTGMMKTDSESVCNYQDMMGHSSEEQLSELANGDYRESFYRVYAESFGITETLRFYTRHSNCIEKIVLERDQLLCDLETEKELKDKYLTSTETLRKNLKETSDALGETMEKLYSTEKEKDEIIKSQAAEITELKAKLYDLMTK